jgi:hypothetical protein
VLWLLEFTRDEHRYRAELRSASSELQTEAQIPPQAFWYVSMDGEPPRLAFEADVRDEDSEAFRDRVVAAARGERIVRGPAGSPDVPLEDPADVKEPNQPQKHHRR